MIDLQTDTEINVLKNNFKSDFRVKLDELLKVMSGVGLDLVMLNADVPLNTSHTMNPKRYYSLHITNKFILCLNGHGDIERFNISQDMDKLLEFSNWFYAYVYIGEINAEIDRILKQIKVSIKQHNEITRYGTNSK